MKKLLVFLAGVFASFFAFGQLQKTNSSFFIGWNYPTNAFATNLTFKLALMENSNPSVIAEYRFLNKPTAITNGLFYFESTNRVTFTPGVNTLVMFAVSDSGLWSDPSKSLILPDLPKTTELKKDKIE